MGKQLEVIKPWEVGWVPMPKDTPPVRQCPICKSMPVWRHALRSFWLICPKCGMSTAAFNDVGTVAAVWNQGTKLTDRVTAATELASEDDTDEEIYEITARMWAEQESDEDDEEDKGDEIPDD